ncbi:tripartite tricarboxylate transporter substrate binding protein [Advenella sp. WQ 585]|uniref:MFS transporter n=2 Tax=Advenella TaxID=290425 RepID=A0A918JK55_9BURK|nr:MULTISPECIES: tripartite tricarboxylate transporter substrate binding protein [Advenella]MBK1782209.1 tripartite tricarboxylate transporter substrate binding protein [Advenella mandrilli]GGW82745.1 MFS transporter [Advenella faeciporci]
MHKKWKILLAATCMAGAVLSNTASADTYPSHAVTMVVPWPPGGPSDIGARPLAAHLQKMLGQSVVIDNRAGAGGNIGSNMVAKAKPDGHTLLLSSSGPFVINPYIYAKMPYDAEKDFTPISNLLQVPLVLVVNPSVPVNNLQELLAYIKEKKGDFQWASAGNGTTQHLTGELFRMTAKLDMVHVPYKGTAPAITDLLGGHVPMMFDSTIAIVPHIKAGKVRPIAISSPERSPLLPEVPTFAEAGLPGVEASAWYGLFAPANTPAEVVNTLNKATLDFMQTSEYKRILDETGSRPVGDTPENFAAFVKQEAIKWKDLVQATNTRLD